MRDRDNKKYLAECLAILKEKCEGGNKAAILKALYQCFLMGAPVPRWLSRAFVQVCEDVAGYKFKSWDQAFGRPHAKRTRPNTRKQYRDLRYPIAICVHQCKAAGESVGKSMFEKIAGKLVKPREAPQISGTTVSEIYYKHGGKEFYEAIKPLLNSRQT
jgi:hypothetical protein